MSIFPNKKVNVITVLMKQKTIGELIVTDNIATTQVERIRGILFLFLLVVKKSIGVQFFNKYIKVFLNPGYCISSLTGYLTCVGYIYGL